MAKEYIERGVVLEKQIGVVVYDEGGWDANVRAVPVEDIEAIPAADVVEVVRCKDCKWCTEKDELTKSGHCDCVHRDVFIESHDGFEAVSFDDYCSYGERRDG